jgi:hypothetical protein
VGTQFNQFINVQNQGDLTIAKDGRTGKTAVLLEIILEGFDNHLLLTEHVIHNQADPSLTGFDDDDEKFIWIFIVFVHAEDLSQTD